MFIGKHRLLPVTVALLSLLIVPLQAQDREAPRNSNRFLLSPTAQRSATNRPILEDQFMIGFNWGPLPHDSAAYKALRIKLVHEGLWPDTSSTGGSYKTLHERMPYGTALIHADNRLSQGVVIPYAMAPSMQFDPVISNLGSPFEFVPRLGDTTGAVWGFKVRNTEIGQVLPENPPTNRQNVNYGRMMFIDSTLRRANGQNGLDSATPRLVLSDIYPNKLQFIDGIDEIRRDYDRVLQHPDLTFNYDKTDMYIYDNRRGWMLWPFEHYTYDTNGNINGTTTASNSYTWLDTSLRHDDRTIIHMKGDSTEWWLAASLRRLPNAAQANITGNQVVMSFRVPVVIRYDTIPYDYSGEIIKDNVRKGTTLHTVYARFDSAAVAGDTIFHDFYGCMDRALGAYNDTVFYIRAGMLPPYDKRVNNEERPDITLSAHFWLPRFEQNNRYETLKPDFGGGIGLPQVPAGALRGYPKTVITPVVVSLDMEVRYHGNVDVALDWTRFESRLARMIVRGVKDSVIERLARDWYTYLDNAAPNRGHFMYGHYLYDEGNGFFWRVQRHMSRLLEDIGTVEAASAFRGQYGNQTKDRHHWISWLGMAGNISAPYIRYGTGGQVDESPSATYASRPDRSMGIFSGYRGAKYQNNSPTALNFETYRARYNPNGPDAALNGALWTLPDSLYRIVLFNSKSVQATIEYNMDERVIHNRELLYGKLPVWYNAWLFSEYELINNPHGDNAQYPKTSYWKFTRPHTGEEIRLINWLALALGGKGLMPYKGNSSFDATDGRGQYGLTCYPSADGGSGRYFSSGQTTGTQGGDFLDSLDKIWDYMNADALAGFMGIAKNRFYVGRKSTFDELARVHTFADNHGPQLMKLQLQAVYSKGYKLITNARDTSVHIERYIDTTGGFAVSKIHNGQGGIPLSPLENYVDSSFVLATLLKDTSKSMDELFYIGLVNRRTSPVVYYPLAGGTDLGDNIKFFTTNEFDSLVTNNKLSHYAYPRYAQEGSRQMTLPIVLDRVLQDSVFSLIRITDLSGTMDTVIAENILPASGRVYLALKFTPGEGKLIRVRILHPGTIPEGELAYSNQRKMVCVPEPNDSTMVRYYMVYHRRDSKRSEVFYRYSKPTNRNSDEANIIWESEEPLSMMVRRKTDGHTEKFDDLNCAYPSLVIRPAEWGKQRVYVVFACEHPDEKTQEQWIVENNFTPIPLPFPMPLPRSAGDVIATASGRSLANWGTPVVSAVARGNIYAWADSVQGIVLGFKPAIIDTLTDTLPVRWSVTSDSAQHPSLATYTRYAKGENSTGLVWQEDEEIYYAQPYVDANGVLDLHHLPVSYDPNAYEGGVTWLPPNEDSTIVAMCEPGCTNHNRIPVIYRGVDPNNLYSGTTITLDRVAWEGHSFGNSNTSLIFSRWIDLETDTTTAEWLPFMLYRSGMNRVFSPEYSFHQADLAQGAQGANRAWWMNNSATVNGSDSAFTMSFVSWYWAGDPVPFTNTKVWHVPFSYRASRQGDRVFPANNQQSHVVAQDGMFPHLAARPAIEPGTWWRNRRVFEFGTKPEILSSAQYFYRTARSDYAVTKVPTFSKACNTLGIFDLWYKNMPIAIEPKAGSGFKPIDTLASDNFPMAGPTEVSFYVTGSDTSLARVELVNVHTGVRSVIPLVPATSTTATLVSVTYTNGGGNMYRVEFIKKTVGEYTTNYLAGPMPLANGSGTIVGFAKAAEEERTETPGTVVNLAVAGTEDAPGLHAYVYPNPAREAVSISVYRSYGENLAVTAERNDDRLMVRVVSMLGTEVARFDARTGVSIELPVKHLPKGVYFVRVEQVGNPQESGVSSFVVE